MTTNLGSVLRAIAVGLFVLALSAGACASGEDATDTGAAGSGGMAGHGGSGGSPVLLEGARCALGTDQNCNPACGAQCGTSAACLEMCCMESTNYGIVCNGACAETCTYADGDDPACAAATAEPQQDNTCRINAIVKGRVYETVATPDASGRGAPEVKCTRTLPNQPPKSIAGVAPGAPCTGAACMACNAAMTFWASACCGR